MADGAALGLTAINVNFTHDFFSELGLGGFAAGCVVTERNTLIAGTPAESVASSVSCTGAHRVVTHPTATPEPGTPAWSTAGQAISLARQARKPAFIGYLTDQPQMGREQLRSSVLG